MLLEIGTVTINKVVSKAIDNFFDKSKKKDTDIVSIGLAFGYFYNFLDPISALIERDELEIFDSPNGTNSQKFNAEDVRVQIIMPIHLNVYALQRCEEELAKVLFT